MGNIADVTTVGGLVLEKAANTTKADILPVQMKSLRRAQAKETELSEVEALQIIQQAIAMGVTAGLLISHKPMIGITEAETKAPVLIIELWQAGICHKCNWWTYEGKCHNPTCREYKPQ